MRSFYIIIALTLASCNGMSQLTPNIRAPRVSQDTSKFSSLNRIPSCPATGIKVFYYRDTLRGIDSTCTVYNLSKISSVGTPGGYSGSVQFNTAGQFDYDTTFYYDKEMHWLWLSTLVFTDILGKYGSISRLETDSVNVNSHINLFLRSAPRPSIPWHGQIWARSSDSRPRWTIGGESGQYSYEMSLPYQGPADSGKFLQTDGTKAVWRTVSTGSDGKYFLKEIESNGENNIELDFDLTSTSKIFYNGSIIPNSRWSGVGTHIISLSLDTRLYDVLIINN